jgi:aromatic-L-amino-acid decarboxylase
MEKAPIQDLQPSAERMEQMVKLAMDHITRLLTTLPEQPMDGTAEATPDYLESLIEPLPESGAGIGELLDRLFNEIAPKSVNTISGGFMAYIGCGGLFESALADLVADSLNRYTGTATIAPALSQIEANVVRWFCELLGLPESSGGFLTSGGSIANLSAVIAARHVMLGEDFLRGTIYISDQTHHCVEKALRLAGFPTGNLRVIESDTRFRLDLAKTEQAIAADRKLGMKPFLLVGSAGTTNSGAIDPLAGCAQLARREGLWFHVDGAYGGFFRLVERGRQALAGIEEADSVVLDPHKTLFLPYGTGALLVRDRETLHRTYRQSADYMPPSRNAPGLMEFCELSPELSKPFRGLRVWLPLKLHGAEAFRSALNEKLDLTGWLEGQILQLPQVEVLSQARLTVITFAVRDRGQGQDVRNRQSRELLQAINRRQRVFLSGTLLQGVYALRVALISFRTHRQHAEMLLQDLQAALQELRLE